MAVMHLPCQGPRSAAVEVRRERERERERRQIERQGRWEVRVERFTQNV
jgi:hypothetical protein